MLECQHVTAETTSGLLAYQKQQRALTQSVISRLILPNEFAKYILYSTPTTQISPVHFQLQPDHYSKEKELLSCHEEGYSHGPGTVSRLPRLASFMVVICTQEKAI